MKDEIGSRKYSLNDTFMSLGWVAPAILTVKFQTKINSFKWNCHGQWIRSQKQSKSAWSVCIELHLVGTQILAIEQLSVLTGGKETGSPKWRKLSH